MVLGKVFSPDRILVDLESETKDELFEELTNAYCLSVPNSDREQILNSVIAREEKGITVIMDGVAVPHGQVAGVDGVKGVIGISKKGVDYGIQCKSEVHIVFMLVYSEKDVSLLLRVLKRLAQFLQNPVYCNKLLTQAASEECYNLVCKFEDTLCSVD